MSRSRQPGAPPPRVERGQGTYGHPDRSFGQVIRDEEPPGGAVAHEENRSWSQDDGLVSGLDDLLTGVGGEEEQRVVVLTHCVSASGPFDLRAHPVGDEQVSEVQLLSGSEALDRPGEPQVHGGKAVADGEPPAGVQFFGCQQAGGA